MAAWVSIHECHPSEQPFGIDGYAISERIARLVSRRAIVVAGLSAIAMAASGCSGDSNAETETPLATTTEQVETEPPVQPTVDIAEFRAAIEESFGASGYETSWYGHVTGMKMAHGRLEIETDVDPLDQETARMVCSAAVAFALNNEAGDGIETATVFGSDGVPLGSCA